MRTCTICHHDERPAIEQAIVAGKPYRRIAAQYGTSEGALRRHRAAHVASRLARAVERRDAETDRAVAAVEQRNERADTELLDQLLAISEETRAILREARGRGENGLALKAIARVESQVELQARLLGQLKDSRLAVHFEFGPEAAERVATAFLARRSPRLIETEAKS